VCRLQYCLQQQQKHPSTHLDLYAVHRHRRSACCRMRSGPRGCACFRAPPCRLYCCALLCLWLDPCAAAHTHSCPLVGLLCCAAFVLHLCHLLHLLCYLLAFSVFDGLHWLVRQHVCHCACC
jgi:hypothetical protein